MDERRGERRVYARGRAGAQRLGVHLLLVHEFPSALDDDASTRGACDFNDMWNEGWTPKHLLTGEANVYKQIAIALKPGAWRRAGLATVLIKMGEGGGELQAWRQDLQLANANVPQDARAEPPPRFLVVNPGELSVRDSTAARGSSIYKRPRPFIVPALPPAALPWPQK